MRELQLLDRIAIRVLAAQSSLYREAIARHFPEGHPRVAPQGGFVVWVELGEETPGRAF